MDSGITKRVTVNLKKEEWEYLEKFYSDWAADMTTSKDVTEAVGYAILAMKLDYPKGKPTSSS